MIAGSFRRLVRGSPRQRDKATVSLGTPDNRFDGLIVLVAGGGRVGRAVSEAFIKVGATVHVVDIRAGCAPLGAIEHVEDLTDPASLDRICERIGATIDIMVHAAGYQPPVGPFEKAEPETWRAAFETNVISAMQLTQRVGRDLKSAGRPGCIVLIASAHHAITGGWPAYSASKAALVMFMREIALEWAPHGIRVNAIAPGWVAEEHEPHAQDFPHTPLGSRAIPPAAIANTALFLCSDLSAFTTGATITVDGGLSLRSYRTAAESGPNDPHIRKYGDD
jgi:NAD(P)-dependent dehydrogenase (short-subunit alcohol dehydrogenase family)